MSQVSNALNRLTQTLMQGAGDERDFALKKAGIEQGNRRWEEQRPIRENQLAAAKKEMDDRERRIAEGKMPLLGTDIMSGGLNLEQSAFMAATLPTILNEVDATLNDKGEVVRKSDGSLVLREDFAGMQNSFFGAIDASTSPKHLLRNKKEALQNALKYGGRAGDMEQVQAQLDKITAIENDPKGTWYREQHVAKKGRLQKGKSILKSMGRDTSLYDEGIASADKNIGRIDATNAATAKEAKRVAIRDEKRDFEAGLLSDAQKREDDVRTMEAFNSDTAEAKKSQRNSLLDMTEDISDYLNKGVDAEGMPLTQDRIDELENRRKQHGDDIANLDTMIREGIRRAADGKLWKNNKDGTFTRVFFDNKGSLVDTSKRLDGSDKGLGYFGKLKRPDGMESTEISTGIGVDGKEIEIPMLVPTLTQKEVDQLLRIPLPPPSGFKFPKPIVDKAIAHYQKRVAEGKSPFAQQGEQGTVAPTAEVPTPAPTDDMSGASPIQEPRAVPASTSPELVPTNPPAGRPGYQVVTEALRNMKDTGAVARRKAKMLKSFVNR